MDLYKKDLSKNWNMLRACSMVILAAFCTGFLMYKFNDTFRNPIRVKSIDQWKLDLQSEPDSRYLGLIKKSFALSLEDSSYYSMSDSEIVAILLSAQIILTDGYVPRVEDQDSKMIQKYRSRFQDEYIAVRIMDCYVLVTDREYRPVWGTRPLEHNIVPSPNLKAVRVPQKIILWHFLFSLYYPSWLKLC